MCYFSKELLSFEIGIYQFYMKITSNFNIFSSQASSLRVDKLHFIDCMQIQNWSLGCLNSNQEQWPRCFYKALLTCTFLL